MRRNPNSRLEESETLDPDQVAWLIVRPTDGDTASQPQWLCFLRALLSGIYTIDNLDFVMRDAYMSGYSRMAYDLDRLLHYSFFTEQGLTIHDRGTDALIRFMGVKAELFRSIYFHRTVRAIDLTLADLFQRSKRYLFPGNPLDHLDDYLAFTESSLLVDVGRWTREADPEKQALGTQWQAVLRRQIPWQMVCQRTLIFGERDQERSSIFSDDKYVEAKIRDALPAEHHDLPMRVDIARHIHRPHTSGPASGQNYLYDSARERIRPLTANELIQRIPVSYRICRVYGQSDTGAAELAMALDGLIGHGGHDDLTNM